MKNSAFFISINITISRYPREKLCCIIKNSSKKKKMAFHRPNLEVKNVFYAYTNRCISIHLNVYKYLVYTFTL